MSRGVVSHHITSHHGQRDEKNKTKPCNRNKDRKRTEIRREGSGDDDDDLDNTWEMERASIQQYVHMCAKKSLARVGGSCSLETDIHDLLACKKTRQRSYQRPRNMRIDCLPTAQDSCPQKTQTHARYARYARYARPRSPRSQLPCTCTHITS